jgi:hypothetical protein
MELVFWGKDVNKYVISVIWGKLEGHGCCRKAGLKLVNRCWLIFCELTHRDISD